MKEILTKYNEDIPDWLKKHINLQCPHCGAPMLDSGPVNDFGRMLLTQRYCPNEYCVGHMGRKIVKLADQFGISGVGDSTARGLIKEFDLKSHMQIIPKWFKEKPLVYLWEVGVASQVYGYDNKWKDIVGGHYSFEQYLADTTVYKDSVVESNIKYLCWCEQFFTLRVPLSKTVIRVMISGSMDGYKSKDEYISYLNSVAGSLIQVRMVGKRKTNVDFLIKEPDTSDHDKTRVALEAGIPIVSSREFMTILINLAKQISSKN